MTVPTEPLLIVDDEPTVCEVVAALAETLGYETLRAQTGADALEILSNQSVAAVLLDIAMPDMSGETVAATMLERGIDPPLVIMTGMVTDDVQQFVEEYPASRCILAKPFMRADLKTALDTVLASGKPGE
ncbi:MAG: response regulator [Pseudomonadota bacterium]